MEHSVSEEYLKTVNVFESCLKNAVSVSQKYEGIPNLAFPKQFASVAFTAVVTRSVTLALLTPHSSFNTDNRHWDYASIGGITRSVLENRLTLYYLCIEDITPEERDFRRRVFELHDCCSRQKLFSNFPDEKKQLANNDGFEGQKVELTSRIKKNAVFNSLLPKKQKTILNGKDAFLMPLEDIAVKTGIELNDFRTYYQLMSSFHHGLPMALLRMGTTIRGRGIYSQTEENYIMMFIELASKLLRESTKEYSELLSVSSNQKKAPL